ncbi:selenium cofactor biosynthesis protein YqeC [Chloroflexota bacterium]
MNLLSALRINKDSRVAFVGSGGKTTAISQLVSEYSNNCIISTTTHLGEWQSGIADQHVIIDDLTKWKEVSNLRRRSLLITGPQVGSRLTGLDSTDIKRCFELCSKRQMPLILECDGSRQLPFKAPKIDEPLIPKLVNTVVVTCGLSGLSKPLGPSTTYHPELYSKLSGIKLGYELTSTGLIKILSHQEGALKRIPDHAKKILLLNQADTPYLQAAACGIAARLENEYDSVVISSLRSGKVFSCFESTSAIILAAGSSTRFGKPKQLLDIRGTPFLSAIIDSAILAGLSPIIVVTGSGHKEISTSIEEYRKDVSIIYNPFWKNGQSTSIQAGLNALEQVSIIMHRKMGNRNERIPGSVIFLLADQPQVGPILLESLVDEHSRNLSPIIAPLVDGQRANPVLFDRTTFQHLSNLSGDVGGRGIFKYIPPTYIHWYDQSILLDVDTNSDHARLLNEIR